MQECNASFWPESLLLMILQVYVIDRETGVYILHGSKGGTSSSASGRRSDKQRRNGLPDMKGVREERMMSEVMFAPEGRIRHGGVGIGGSGGGSGDYGSGGGSGGGGGGRRMNGMDSSDESGDTEEDSGDEVKEDKYESRFDCTGGDESPCTIH